jgi:hypothetical protein
MASLHSSAFPDLAIRNSLEEFLTPVTCGFGGANQPDYLIFVSFVPPSSPLCLVRLKRDPRLDRGTQ